MKDNDPAVASDQALPVRLIIVGDGGSATAALRRSLERLPGAVIVAQLSQISLAQTYPEPAEADLLIIGAAALPQSRRGSDLAALWPSEQSAGTDFISESSNVSQADATRVASLSQRECQIFDLLAVGLSNRDLSRLLGVTERTVKAHIGSIMAKLKLESRLQVGLAAFAYQLVKGEPAASPFQPGMRSPSGVPAP